MKKNVIQWATLSAIMLMALWMSACQNGGKSTENEVNEEDSEEVKEKAANIVFKTFESHVSDEKCNVDYVVSYPVGGADSALVACVRTWINKALGDTYTGDLANAQELVDHYVAVNREEFDYEDFFPEENEPLSFSIDSIYVMYECNDYVTIVSSGYYYPSGAAHGMPHYFGATIKSNGTIEWDMFKDSKSDTFQSIIKDGLREHFELGKNENLSEYLFPDLGKKIPLPTCPPLLTDKGVMFIYGAYEIVPYSYGMPQFTVPYDRMKEVMGQGLISLLGLE